MLVRRLVTGVRSSCEASATSWRWARIESSSSAREPSRRSSIELKRVASWPTSSSAWTRIRFDRSSVSPMCCAAWATSASGASARRAARRPSPAASAIPPRNTRNRTSRRLERIESMPFSGRASCSAAGIVTPSIGTRTGNVSTRRWSSPTCTSVMYEPVCVAAIWRSRALDRDRDVARPLPTRGTLTRSRARSGCTAPGRLRSRESRESRRELLGALHDRLLLAQSACRPGRAADRGRRSNRPAPRSGPPPRPMPRRSARFCGAATRQTSELSPAARSRRPGPCAAAAVRPRLRSCGAGNPCRRRARWRSVRSRSPTHSRRSSNGSAPAAGGA